MTTIAEGGGGPRAAEVVVLAEERSYWADVRHRFFRNKMAVLGLVVFVVLLLIAIFGRLLLKVDYTQTRDGLGLQRIGSKVGVLGTDDLGRDIMRRVVHGLGISVSLALVVTIIDIAIAMVLGGIAGYFGGWIDNVITRIIDILYAIPYFLIAVAFVTIWGHSFFIVMLALVVVGWLDTARLFRAAVLQVRSLDYIEAARSTGASTKRVIMQHVVPNALPPIIVAIAFSISTTVQQESIFSFLGIGITAPTPSIGVMINDSINNYQQYPHLLLVPVIALVLLTLSIVLIGDGLRDALDPKMRGLR
jgi:ABC-type dipeptide/oligopeptide/nickel transport system permease subunit